MAEAKALVMIPRCEKSVIRYETRELVMCKDCRHFMQQVHSCRHLYASASPEGFCSDGQRREVSNDE